MKQSLFLTLSFLFFLGCSGTHQDGGSVTASGSGGEAQFSTECGPMAGEACEAFLLVNQERMAQGQQALLASSSCISAAQSHAEDMDQNNYFSHDGLNETWSERMQRFQVSGARAENIAQAGNADSAVSNWMQSSGHRANILNSNLVYSGMGYSNGYWVQCFSSNP